MQGERKNTWYQTLAPIVIFAELPHSLAFAFGRLRILWESANFSRKLRRELPADEKEKIMQIIKNISGEDGKE